MLQSFHQGLEINKRKGRGHSRQWILYSPLDFCLIGENLDRGLFPLLIEGSLENQNRESGRHEIDLVLAFISRKHGTCISIKDSSSYNCWEINALMAFGTGDKWLNMRLEVIFFPLQGAFHSFHVLPLSHKSLSNLFHTFRQEGKGLMYDSKQMSFH